MNSVKSIMDRPEIQVLAIPSTSDADKTVIEFVKETVGAWKKAGRSIPMLRVIEVAQHREMYSEAMGIVIQDLALKGSEAWVETLEPPIVAYKQQNLTGTQRCQIRIVECLLN